MVIAAYQQSHPVDVLITVDKWRKALICGDAVDIAPKGMSAIPFHSKLEPHFDFILGERRKGKTWEAIADTLTTQGTPTTKQAVHAFIKRRLKRRYPLGAAPLEKLPTVTTRPQVEAALSSMPDLTEGEPAPSDFASDPLTRPLKKKSKWNIIN